MWNTPKATRLAKIPAIGATEEIAAADKKLYLHFFLGGCDWYAAEFDHVDQDTFFGFVILHNDKQNAEWGYFSLSELAGVRSGFAEVDCERAKYFPVQKAKMVSDISDLV